MLKYVMMAIMLASVTVTAGEGASVFCPDPVTPEREYVMRDGDLVPEPGSAANAAVVTAAMLEGKTYTLTAMNGVAFTPSRGQLPFIVFSEGMRLNGRACNNFAGQGALQEGKLTMANAAMTRMMCLDAALNEYERAFHAMLRQGATVTLEGDVLTLSGQGILYTYKNQPATE